MDNDEPMSIHGKEIKRNKSSPKSSGIEDFPVEVIGNMLSCLGDPRYVIRASTTCRKWRKAFCKHLRKLSFDLDCRFYHDIPTSQLELLITRTVFETTGLHDLSLSGMGKHAFSAALVTVWLTRTMETLRQLSYGIKTSSSVNILDLLTRKLEVLELSYNLIKAVHPNFHTFPCLRSLTLVGVKISSKHFSLLLTMCPAIETLKVLNCCIKMFGEEAEVKFQSPTLKAIVTDTLDLKRCIFEVDGIQNLELKDCKFHEFELVCKGNLRHLRIKDLSTPRLNVVGPVDNLESLLVDTFEASWYEFFCIIAKSSKLKWIKLRNIRIKDDQDYAFMGFEVFATCFPQLTHLSLGIKTEPAALKYCFRGSSELKNVVYLELYWDVDLDDFEEWVAKAIRRCPKLKKLKIIGVVKNCDDNEMFDCLSCFSTSMVSLIREYKHVDVQFEYQELLAE